MPRVLSLTLIFFLLFYQGALALEPALPLTEAETAAAIRLYYESRLQELMPIYRGHWALRLFRLTGDARYLGPLRMYGDDLFEDFTKFVRGTDDPAFITRQTEELLGPARRRNEKYQKRRQVLARAGHYLYMHQLLYLTFMIQSVGLDQRDRRMYQAALAALKRFSFQPYLAQTDLLLYNAAEMSNDVYYLKTLSLGNFEKEYVGSFQSAHKATDESGDPVFFENKIYGMTHLMIAASEYYQKKVSPKEFRWILDYFDKNVELILTRLKPDVAAEVGLCFMLAGQAGHPVVTKTRKFVASAWDPASGMIPSVRGHTDLNHGEHRNVLAWMLLTGFNRLYAGPDLNALSPLQKNP